MEKNQDHTNTDIEQAMQQFRESHLRQTAEDVVFAMQWYRAHPNLITGELPAELHDAFVRNNKREPFQDDKRNSLCDDAVRPNFEAFLTEKAENKMKPKLPFIAPPERTTDTPEKIAERQEHARCLEMNRRKVIQQFELEMRLFDLDRTAHRGDTFGGPVPERIAQGWTVEPGRYAMAEDGFGVIDKGDGWAPTRLKIVR